MAGVIFGDNWSIGMKFDESADLTAVWTIEKWSHIEEDIPSRILRAKPWYYGRPEVIVTEPNKIVNAGLNLMLDIMAGRSFSYFANWSAYIGAGDSNLAAAAGQTDLQAATNKTRKAMNSGYPTAAASQKNTYQSDFGAAEALYAFEEFGLFNASSGGTMFARKVQAAGTHAGVWTIACEITASSKN